MAHLRQLQRSLFLTIVTLLPAILAVSTTLNMSLPRCPNKCGNIIIPYPFGIHPGCYRDSFDITCNESTTPPKAFIGSGNIELIDINITTGEARAYKYISFVCYNQIDNINSSDIRYMSLIPPYLFSNQQNKFTVIGCDTLAYIVGEDHNHSYLSGCVSYCVSQNSTIGDGGSCNGLGCCQTAIPAELDYYGVLFSNENNSAWEFNPCNYAMMVDDDWYKFQVQDLSGFDFYNSNKKRVPFVLDWAIRFNGTCQDSVEHSTNPACLSNHSSCNNTSNGDGYLCQCKPGYEGNPYLPSGCIDIDECKSPDKYPCRGSCKNTDGSYKCSCKGFFTHGKPQMGKDASCNTDTARVAIFSVVGIAILLGLCFLVATHLQHKRHVKEKEEYKKYYQMMDNHLRVFSRRQIANATNDFGETNVLGAGGQGKVYKGLLENNQAVAIKKAREVEETQRGEFVNEIILLSQINHKNIVRLLGCCLEVKIPMLVYEFVSNGTLFELLHRNTTRPISLGTRLKIALESAMALDYLHSSISRSIIHGDVKSANILLDANFTVKVSDFGASSVVPIDEIVELVHFSHGYLDPESLYTQTITKNSDVYSFGVVLLELVTRKEAIYIDEKDEKQPLATCFLSKARKSEHHEILDVEIVINDEKAMVVLEEICAIAAQCLSPKGEDRPTMWQVVEELHKLARFHNSLHGLQIDPEETDRLLRETNFRSVSDVSAFNNTQYSAALEISTGAPR